MDLWYELERHVQELDPLVCGFIGLILCGIAILYASAYGALHRYPDHHTVKDDIAEKTRVQVPSTPPRRRAGSTGTVDEESDHMLKELTFSPALPLYRQFGDLTYDSTLKRKSYSPKRKQPRTPSRRVSAPGMDTRGLGLTDTPTGRRSQRIMHTPASKKKK